MKIIREGSEKALPWTLVAFARSNGVLPHPSPRNDRSVRRLTVHCRTLEKPARQWMDHHTSRLPRLAKATVNLTLTEQSPCRKQLRHGRCNVRLAQPGWGMRVRES